MLSCRPKKDRVIKEGDLVIVYEGFTSLRAVRVENNGNFQNRYGLFKHNNWFGLSYGSKVYSLKGNGYVHLLFPTPELWTMVLSHRTQILYAADIALVTTCLELKPGCIVLESGTGSGSLTTSLARAISPNGHVHTFDFHEQRSILAREDFEKNGLSNLVTVTLRDIQGDGFPNQFSGLVDAIFLDLPSPWLVIPSAAASLKSDGCFASFSPCIEQVANTCEALSNCHFTNIRTFEVLVRVYEVKKEHLITNLDEDEDEDEDENEDANGDKEEREGEEGEEKEKEKKNPLLSSLKKEILDSSIMDTSGKLEEICTVKVELDEVKSSGPALHNAGAIATKTSNVETTLPRKRKTCGSSFMNDSTRQRVIARPVMDAKGHTGYLTFARNAVKNE